MVKVKYTSKRIRFLKVAEARTQSAINRIRIIGNCSNKSLYEYSPEEIDKIFRALQNQISETRARFTIKKNKEFRI